MSQHYTQNLHSLGASLVFGGAVDALQQYSEGAMSMRDFCAEMAGVAETLLGQENVFAPPIHGNEAAPAMRALRQATETASAPLSVVNAMAVDDGAFLGIMRAAEARSRSEGRTGPIAAMTGLLSAFQGVDSAIFQTWNPWYLGIEKLQADSAARPASVPHAGPAAAAPRAG